MNVWKAFLHNISSHIKREREERRDVLVLGDFNSPKDHQEIISLFAQHNMVDLVPNNTHQHAQDQHLHQDQQKQNLVQQGLRKAWQHLEYILKSYLTNWTLDYWR